MKIDYIVFLIVFLAPILLNHVSAESKVIDGSSDLKAESRGNDDSVKGITSPINKSDDAGLNANDSSKNMEMEGEKKPTKMDVGAVTGEQKQSKGSGYDSMSDKKVVPTVDGKCESSSTSCTDDDKTLLACLRVPGNDSLDHSLLIQNKGKGPLNVTISAPDLVWLEKHIQLQEKEDRELKASMKGVENGGFIILTAGHGDCRLDFSDLLGHSNKKGDVKSNSLFFTLFHKTSLLALLCFAALAAAVVPVLAFVLWRRRVGGKGPKYQMLDMELPISHGGKLDSGTNEGWDDNWGDDWDDEAPKTPSFPLTPSFSSQGMASRKFNKDTWKD